MICTRALLAVAIAMASLHVGGSAQAQFDTVISVPADRVSISGSVGNASGELSPTTQLNVADGGIVSADFDAFAGSEVNITGGSVGAGFTAENGSEVNISGGRVGVGFRAEDGSDVNISGGTLGLGFAADRGSDVELIGGEFVRNGTPFSGSTISLGDLDVFTGTLADGSPFVFSDAEALDYLRDVTLTSVALPALDTSPLFLSSDVSAGSAGPSGLRAGQRLTLQEGGVLGDNYTVVNATLDVEDGVVGDYAEAAGSVVNITGGSVGSFFQALHGTMLKIGGGSVGERFYAHSGSEVTISGGSVGSFFLALPGSEVSISGGSLGEDFLARGGSVVNIRGGSVGNGLTAGIGSEVNTSGGSIGERFDTSLGSVVNISGGSVGEGFSAFSNGDVNLFGTEFYLNGELLDSLAVGDTFEITGRDGAVLSGTLADGSVFDFVLNGSFIPGQDFFSPGADLTVALVPSPGDFDGDGFVNLADLSIWRSEFGLQVMPFTRADGNGDGMIDAADYTVWRDNLPGESVGVPEPAALVLFTIALLPTTKRRR